MMMRAKMQVNRVEAYRDAAGEVAGVELGFSAVCWDEEFGPDGESEDNTFARYTPTAELTMDVRNPALFGSFAVGDAFYVDFTPA